MTAIVFIIAIGIYVAYRIARHCEPSGEPHTTAEHEQILKEITGKSESEIRRILKNKRKY